MAQPLFKTLCQTSIPQRAAYHASRSNASSVLVIGTVVNSSHSTASTPGGGLGSQAQTAQTVMFGSLSLARLLGGRSLTCRHRTRTVALRAGCPARAPRWTVTVAATAALAIAAHRYFSRWSALRSC